jgi:hypothetical protein
MKKIKIMLLLWLFMYYFECRTWHRGDWDKIRSLEPNLIQLLSIRRKFGHIMIYQGHVHSEKTMFRHKTATACNSRRDCRRNQSDSHLHLEFPNSNLGKNTFLLSTQFVAFNYGNPNKLISLHCYVRLSYGQEVNGGALWDS